MKIATQIISLTDSDYTTDLPNDEKHLKNYKSCTVVKNRVLQYLPKRADCSIGQEVTGMQYL